jgi:hypothetical protein
MDVLRTSLDLLRTSLRLWARNPRFIAFPLLWALAVFGLAVLLHLLGLRSAETPVIAALGLLDPDVLRLQEHGALHLVVGVLVTLTALVFNAALVRAVLTTMDGERNGIRTCISFALGRLGALVGYAAIAFVAGHLFMLLAVDRGGLEGFVLRLGWQVWTLATYLVIPIIVQEDRSSVASVRRSTQLFAGNWKQLVLGDLYLRALVGVVILLILGLAAFEFVAEAGPARRFIAFAFFGVLLWFVVLRTIHGCVLYRFAVDGKIPGARRDEPEDEHAAEPADEVD